MVMLANEVHALKELHSMVVTESGMAILANDLHLKKACAPMVVTDVGIITVFKLSAL